MLKNYLTVAWRNIFRNKTSSFINISGLASGMAVAMLICLWIWDELSFDKYHQNYDRIAQVMQHETYNGTISTGGAIPLPLDAELRKSYGSDFKHIVMASWTENHILAVGDKKISFKGNFMGADAPEMFTLTMREGNPNGLKDRSSILISHSAANALFGKESALNKVINLDDKSVFKVTGVYEDLQHNTTLHDLDFIAPWESYITTPGNERSLSDWGDNSLMMYVQIADNANMDKVSAKIKNIKLDKMDLADKKYKPVIFLQPMSKWHLYSEFKNGINTGGAIEYVWLFGIVGMFVLLLACINFMNLSTARSEKRAKEIGIRKAVGSLRNQLISQFFCESLLMAALASTLAFFLVSFALPFFNEIADKKVTILWANPMFWIFCLCFTLFTAVVAGIYPALYLSSFNPVKVLKGTFKAGNLAAVPRKILVVTQFAVSVILIIATVIVFKQIQFAKNRPVGYNKDGLVNIEVTNDDLQKHFEAVRQDLLRSGYVTEVAESSSSTTGINNNRGDVEWKGKDPAITSFFAWIGVTSEYAKTIGLQFIDGRDFSSNLTTDSSAIIINEATVRFMNLKNPIGEIIKIGGRDLTVIGVVKDMVMDSPYDPAKQTIFHISRHFDDILIKIEPNVSAHMAIDKIEEICKIYSPSVPFSYKFANDEYAKKFAAEDRVGKLATCFAVLAIFISCLGLFGMASFMVEQRIKEIGVRKVLGASVLSLWQLLSKEFVMLIIISLLIAIPIAYYLMHRWLDNYQYKTTLPWWIFAATGVGALLITLITVSFQSIKAAIANPVKSLRTE